MQSIGWMLTLGLLVLLAGCEEPRATVELRQAGAPDGQGQPYADDHAFDSPDEMPVQTPVPGIVDAVTGVPFDTHESLTVAYIDTRTRINNLLDTIKDRNTSLAAKPQLEILVAELVDLRRRRRQLGEPSPEVQQGLNDAYLSAMRNVDGREFNNRMRLAVTDGAMDEIRPWVQTLKPAGIREIDF